MRQTKRMIRTPRILLAATAVLLSGLGLALVPATALASHTQESIFQDDSLLGTPSVASQLGALQQLKGLGVDTVRILVRWSSLAPSPNSTHRPNVDLTNPNSYRASAWAPYDNLVRSAQTVGIRVMLDPSPGLPRWAQTARCPAAPASAQGVCNANPALFQKFVQAIGTRYSGSFKGLPKVNAWEVWNEPNQIGWLGPQFKYGPHHTLIPIAAPLYRRLAVGAITGLAASGHTGAAGDRILVGETAPIGNSYIRGINGMNANPTVFLESVFCLNSHLSKLTGLAARQQGCTGAYRKLKATGFAHHPYQQGGFFSPYRSNPAGDITLPYVNRLEAILDAAARAGRITGPGLPIYYTEYGFQTNPPDPNGISLNNQATYLNESDYIAFNEPRVQGVDQYLLHDDFSSGGFHTGLEYFSGKPKPSLNAYRLPLWVVRQGRNVLVWGQVRPADHKVAQKVAIQELIGGTFVTQGQAFTVNANGAPNAQSYFATPMRGIASSYRIAWQDPASNITYYSRSTPAYARLP